MTRTSKFVTAVASLALASALAGCTITAAPPTVDPAPQHTPTPTYLTELPEWAQGTTWLIYPDGMECWGTEGCPNDYRALIGEPGPVLPAGVEYYDPAKHDCKFVQPADVTC